MLSRNLGSLIWIAGVLIGLILLLVNLIRYAVQQAIDEYRFLQKVDEDLAAHEKEDNLKPETKLILKMELYLYYLYYYKR